MSGLSVLSKFNFVQRQLRRSKFIRSLVFSDLRRIRAKSSELHWKYEHNFLAGIGLYITVWAGIERMINTLIVNYHSATTTELGKSPFPNDFGNKIKYLVSMSNDPELPDDPKVHLKAWVPELGRQGQHRHLIVHGGGYRHRKLGNLEWEFQKLTLKGNDFELTTTKLSHEELLEAQRKASELSHSIASVLNPIFFPTHWSVTSRP